MVLFLRLLEDSHGEVLGADCKWVIGGLTAAVVGLCTVIGVLAKGWIGEVRLRLGDRDATVSQLLASREYSAKKKEISP